MRAILTTAAVALSFVLAVPVFAHGGESKGTEVSHPWVRATPGGSKITAAFMEIKSEAGDKLVAVKSPAAGRAEVHTHVMEADVMKMLRVDALEIAKGGAKLLKPGGDHIMLMDVKEPLKEGDLVKLTLTFETAGDIEVEATVEAAGATGPHGLDQQPREDKSKGEHQHHDSH